MSFEKFPSIKVKGHDNSCITGWNAISNEVERRINEINKDRKVIIIECYHGVYYNEIQNWIANSFGYNNLFLSHESMISEEEINILTKPDVTDHRIFGFLTRLNMIDYFDKKKLASSKRNINNSGEGTTFIFGYGASLSCDNPDLLIYADMARWETQLRMRANKVSNLGLSNFEASFEKQYQIAYFVDWRVCDRLKKKLMNKWDFVLDTNDHENPKLFSGKAISDGLKQAVNQPFSIVPFFDPGPWGGQWMREVCDLDKEPDNFAWCFNCVPEEESLLLQFGETKVEIPSIYLVFNQPRELLGDAIHARFGDEFPILFVFLGTIGGGNLSLLIHPLTEYIQEHFGIPYTQDESYYMMDAKPGAKVYLGLKEGVEPEEMINALEDSEKSYPF